MTPLSKEDSEQLRLLSIGHYVVAGMLALFGFFPIIHLTMGIWMLTSPEAMHARNGPPLALLGGFFVAFAALWMLTAWSLAVCLVVAGRSLAQRKRRLFCLIVAGVAAMMCMPFGTILGVLTFVVMMRPAVREAFEGTAPAVSA